MSRTQSHSGSVFDNSSVIAAGRLVRTMFVLPYPAMSAVFETYCIAFCLAPYTPRFTELENRPFRLGT
jgi:hypothetical protein